VHTWQDMVADALHLAERERRGPARRRRVLPPAVDETERPSRNEPSSRQRKVCPSRGGETDNNHSPTGTNQLREPAERSDGVHVVKRCHGHDSIE
jgi:hypothetical protein